MKIDKDYLMFSLLVGGASLAISLGCFLFFVRNTFLSFFLLPTITIGIWTFKKYPRAVKTVGPCAAFILAGLALFLMFSFDSLMLAAAGFSFFAETDMVSATFITYAVLGGVFIAAIFTGIFMLFTIGMFHAIRLFKKEFKK